MSSYKIKILLCGPAGSGKTELLMQIVKSRFQTDYKLTVGVDILTKDVEFEEGRIITLSLWDIGGQERFNFIRSTFYKGAAGAILVFDPQYPAQWDAIKNWRAEVRQFSGDVPFILIANNTRDVDINDRFEYTDYAESQNSLYCEITKLKADDLHEPIVNLVDKIVNKRY